MRLRIMAVLLIALIAGGVYGEDARARYLKTRFLKNRPALMAQYGGTEAGEQAVAGTLAWFITQQEPDGRWSPEETCKRCGDGLPATAQYEWSISNTLIDVPVTGLVLLCFSSAGPDTAKEYNAAYLKGLKWLSAQQHEDGDFGGKNYTNAIAAHALIEGYAVTGDPKIKAAAQKTVDLLIGRQCETGGWDYGGSSARSDLSVAGWAVHALSAAEEMGMLRCRRINRASKPGPLYADGPLAGVYALLEKVVPEVKDDKLGQDAWYMYSTAAAEPDRGHQNGSMTAVAAYCMVKTGRVDRDPRFYALANRMMDCRVMNTGHRNWYAWNYTTQACFQIGGAYWTEWNRHMQVILPRLQRTDEAVKGSWDPQGDYASEYTGRYFSTAVACLCLQTCYRYPRTAPDIAPPPGFPPPYSAEVEGVKELQWDTDADKEKKADDNTGTPAAEGPGMIEEGETF